MADLLNATLVQANGTVTNCTHFTGSRMYHFSCLTAPAGDYIIMTPKRALLMFSMVVVFMLCHLVMIYFLGMIVGRVKTAKMIQKCGNERERMDLVNGLLRGGSRKDEIEREVCYDRWPGEQEIKYDV